MDRLIKHKPATFFKMEVVIAEVLLTCEWRSRGWYGMDRPLSSTPATKQGLIQSKVLSLVLSQVEHGVTSWSVRTKTTSRQPLIELLVLSQVWSGVSADFYQGHS